MVYVKGICRHICHLGEFSEVRCKNNKRTSDQCAAGLAAFLRCCGIKLVFVALPVLVIILFAIFD